MPNIPAPLTVASAPAARSPSPAGEAAARISLPEDKPAAKTLTSRGSASSDNPPPAGGATAPADGDFDTVLKGHVKSLSSKSKQPKTTKDGDAGKDASAAAQTGQGSGLTALFVASSSKGGQVAASGKADGGGAALEAITGGKEGKHSQLAGKATQKKGKGAAEFAAAGNDLPATAVGKAGAKKVAFDKAVVDKDGVGKGAERHPELKVRASDAPAEKGAVSASVKSELLVRGRVGKDEPPRPIQGGDGRLSAVPHGGVNPHIRAEASQPGGAQSANLTVEPRVGAPGWDGALGQKVAWIATHNHQVAELHLNPPNLGPLEVRVTVSHDQASALFVSHHGAVRDAIESALPRLREMLAGNGLTLGNVSVSSQSFSQQQQSFSGGGAQNGWQGSASPGLAGNEPFFAGHGASAVLAFNNGLVDIFA